jgi:hypothetical protein
VVACQSIRDSVLVFMSTTRRGFQIEYPAITLHAVSRAESRPSIYCQLDEHAGEAEAAASNDEMNDMRELSIVPQSASSCTFITVWYATKSDPVQWNQYSRPFLGVRLCTPTNLRPRTTKRWTHSLTRTAEALRFLLETRTRNSAKSGGCAAISSTITDTRHTRTWLPIPQAALAHLESIIYHPEAQPEANGAVNGDAGGEASEEENAVTAPPA